MKYFLSAIAFVGVLISFLFFGGQKSEAQNYIKIDIVANSTSLADCEIRECVMDMIVDDINKQASSNVSKQKKSIKEIKQIQFETNQFLINKGCDYCAVCQLVETCELRIELGYAAGESCTYVLFSNIAFCD